MNKRDIKSELEQRADGGHYDAQIKIFESIQTEELTNSIGEVTEKLVYLRTSIDKSTEKIIESNEKLSKSTNLHNRRLIQLTAALVFVGILPIAINLIKYFLS